eukprot:TRINITY_DN974_c0_g1_i1.p1 TRINITY_DN974_c0_g1~~TRINITY_DN974_c0_g1_i1.p1  ORF type:complete len:289 (+),score=28.43 TRINITY_DN974_c0_g1_i1:43-909(+)
MEMLTIEPENTRTNSIHEQGRRRLENVLRHIAINSSDITPSLTSWKEEVEEISRRKELARGHGGEEAVERQRLAGKLTARLRIEKLVDKGTFQEIGSLTAVKVTYSSSSNQTTKPTQNSTSGNTKPGQPKANSKIETYLPANFLIGRARINGRHVMVGVDDFTVRGGHADGGMYKKQMYGEMLAREQRIPMIRLLDGSSGGGSVATILEIDRTYLPLLPGFEHKVAMMSEVPVAAGLLGPVVGLGAARAMLAHFSVLVRNLSQLFVAGPPVVAYASHEYITKEQLGGM